MMEKANSKFRIFSFFEQCLIILYCALTILPYFSKNLNPTVTLAICLAITLFAVVRNFPNCYTTLAFVLIWIVYIVFEYFRVADNTTYGNLLSSILFCFPIVITARNDMNEIKWITNVFCVTQTYVAIVNIKVLLEDPTVQKYVTGGIEDKYQYTNIGGLTSVFSSVILVLIGCYLLITVKKKFIKFLLLAIEIINIVYIYLAGSMICLVVTILGILSFLFLAVIKKQETRIIAFFVIFVIFIVILLSFDRIVDYIVNNYNVNVYYKKRLLDTDSYMSGDKGDSLSGRIDLYFVSIASFIKHPVIGVGMIYNAEDSVVGMHSGILDFLARFGLFGVAIFCLMLYFYIRIRKDTAKTSVKTNIVPLFILIFIYALLNPYMDLTSGTITFLVLPAFYNVLTKSDAFSVDTQGDNK